MAKTHCIHCGTVMQQHDVEGRMREVCPACHHICYRNPVPAVGTIVALEERIVLVRRKFEPQANAWCLPAGYMELDESVEEAAIRECYEETGLHVQVDSLIGVYSFGEGVASGLVIIYSSTTIGGALQAGDDASEVGTFAVDDLPRPMAFEIHLQAIARWQQSTGTPLPCSAVPVSLNTRQGVVVRLARASDCQRVLALLALLPRSQVQSTNQALMCSVQFHECIRTTDTPVLVAEVNGTVAGFVTLSFWRGLTGWRSAMNDLLVDPAYRRRGVGQALVQAALRLARSRGCQTLQMDDANSTQEMQSFYQACGFNAGNAATLRVL